VLGSDELLSRMAQILRNDIGPAVTEPFPKTQAFMAAVILDKVSAQLHHAAGHAAADAADRAGLAADLASQVTAADPAPLRDAVAALATGGDEVLGRVVTALYDGRDALGAERFDALLARVRRTLRARLDRQLEVAS